MELTDDVKFVKGVGPNRVVLLNRLGIFTLKDLLTYFPREHEDRGKPKKITDVLDGETVLIKAICVSKMSEARIRRGLTLYKLIVRDDSGVCQITWYNQSYIKNKFVLGKTYLFYGKVSNKFGKIEMNAPVFDEEGQNKNTGKIMPIYPLTYSLSQNIIRQIIENGLKQVENELDESLPEYILSENNLCEINDAIQNIHFPNSFEDYNRARRRLVFEELFTMQLSLLNLKNQYETSNDGISFSNDVKMDEIIEKLPFKLTNAQKKVLNEINRDMDANKPMNRLLQGDVGSGKTIVALIAAYKAVKCGYQATIMAPTAILAKQHLDSFNSILANEGIKCELLVSGITKKKKEEILEKLSIGQIDILIGTHALLEENVIYKNLGLVVTDEQHRFGVKQRKTISEKGNNPDTLVMTATPIPRTLALILYGDLDISIIDELPPNRKKIDTFAVTKGMTERVNNFIKKQIDEGRQAYVVCPLVDENEEINAKSVMELAENYKTNVFKDYRVEYMHGKLRPKEKDAIMNDFKDGKIDILISTTVIEVGVNVPNASIMVIENAERFGLAQLHQLRGRVGRGEYQSYCILKYQGNSEIIRERMQVMTKTNDGFIISEKDLELRGSGEFFGTKQHGIPEFKIANLFEDMNVLKEIQEVCQKILKDDPKLEKQKNKKLKRIVDTKLKINI